MHRSLLVAAILLSSGLADAAESVATLLSVCRPVAEAKVASDGTVRLPQTFDAGVCWGAFATYQEAFSLIHPDGSPYLPKVCTPRGVKRSQEIAVFVEYATRHPERHHEPPIQAVIDALQAAFPCSTSDKK